LIAAVDNELTVSAARKPPQTPLSRFDREIRSRDAPIQLQVNPVGFGGQMLRHYVTPMINWRDPRHFP